MAIDGTYECITASPLGPQKSKLILKTEGDTLTGTYEGSRGADPIYGGEVNGNEFEFRVKPKTPFGRAEVIVKGKVEGDIMTGVIKTPLGSPALKGKRI